MDGKAAPDVSRDAAGHEAVALVKPKGSSVPEYPIVDYVSSVSTFGGMSGCAGTLLIFILVCYVLIYPIKKRAKHALTFLSLSVMLLLLAIAGITSEISELFHSGIETPKTVQDCFVCVHIAFATRWWMLAVSVVTIPLGIYWTVSAYANEILSRCSVQDEEGSD